jgi:uncharacterized membrane protein YdbT with pleckstrin-like domain
VRPQLARQLEYRPLVGWLTAARENRVRERLLRDRDVMEVVVDEVHHHWVVYLPSFLEVLGSLVLVWVALVTSDKAAWVPLLLAAGLLGYAGWRWLDHFLDVFVITDLRVFRVTGVLSSNHSSTPLTRILDITVRRPALGRMLGYGHFTFESAAQEQGLRDIRYVGRPLQRDERIQSLQVMLLTRKRPEPGQ